MCQCSAQIYPTLAANIVQLLCMKTDKYFLQTKPVPAVLAGGYLTKVYVMETWLTV